MQDVHPFHQVIISLVLGLVVGLQRQWADSPLAGIRTFSLVSIFGTVCALLAEKYGQWIIGAGFLSIGVAIIAGHLQKKLNQALAEHSGLVTELAMFLMYSSGVLVRAGPIWLAATIAGILAVILQAKLELHGLAKRFSDKEIRAIMQFVLISFVIFPVVPNQSFGPFGVLNPHEAWLMVMIIVAISLSGYIIYKFFGEKAGIILGGILGGVISSTATTLSYSKRADELNKSIPSGAIVVLIAWTTVYVRIFLEVVVAAPSFQAIWPPLGGMFLISVLCTFWKWRESESNGEGMPTQSNPAELRTALMFGVLYSIILLAVAYSKTFFGSGGLSVVAVLSGVTDMDAITLSTSRLVEAGKLLPQEGWPIIIIASMSNVFFKGAIAGFIGGRAFFRALFIPWLISLVAGATILLVWWV
ncbi:MAG: hypothetical protein A4S09_15225 [Proteobacteria bacterium SG_bin7]|nr:MAG: hypothetical protein A4S09_15225 [Proteobacteria bacterium SG_bin7]